jgi:hypothetical protein
VEERLDIRLRKDLSPHKDVKGGREFSSPLILINNIA